MGILTRHLVKANTQAGELQNKLDRIGRLFKAGALTTGAGFGLAMTLKAATNEAVRYEQQMNRLKALNLDNKFGGGSTASLAAQAQAIAKSTAGTTQLEALRLVTETQAITGDMKHTAELAPVLARMRFGMEAYMSGQGKGEGHGAGAEKQFADIVKVMEMRGLMRNFTSEKLDRMADLFVKNYAASGGMVKPSDFLAMMKTGGVAGKSVNDDFMFALGHIMQEKGGQRSGQQMMSAYQNLVAGRTTQQVAEQMAKYGLLDPHQIKYGTTGHITKVAPGALAQSQLMIDNPLAWLNTVLLPKLAAKGVDINNTNKVLPIINQMASNRNAADFLAQLYLERGQIGNYMAQAQNAMGMNALYAQGKGSTVGQQIDLQAKVNQLELEFGTAALPLLKAALEQAIPLVKQMGEWIGKHPDGLKNLVYSIAGLSVAMMVSGPLMVLGSGIKLLGVALEFGGAGGVAASLGRSAAALRYLGGAAAALGAGYAVGSVIHDNLSDAHKDRGGHNIAWLLALLGNKEAQDALDQESKTVRSGRSFSSAGNSAVYMDGKKVGEIVSGHQARAAGRPTGGTSGFDGSMMQRPVGAGFRG
ncbi:hypothetical protein [Sideroxydans lithotrophicus]|nr:hypothetical protein [Sideroxydans lithotrophicus]